MLLHLSYLLGFHRGFEPEDSIVESLSRSQPRSKEAFWNRVETFSVSLRQNNTLVTGNEGSMLLILVGVDPVDPYHTVAILDLKRGWTGINNVLRITYAF